MIKLEAVAAGRFEVVAPNFFFIPFKRMEVESDPVTNRTYFISGGRIVAVAKPRGSSQ